MITLKNKYLTVKIDPRGAQIASITENGQEKMWQADADVWGSHGPLLFPVCGSMKDDKYILDGETYSMPKHGFAKDSKFTIELIDRSTVTLLLKSNETTHQWYPFDFELRAEYTLLRKSLTVKYSVKNVGDNTMYFGIGSHEAYACQGGIENYDLLFPKTETLTHTVLDGPYLTRETVPIVKSSRTLPLSYKLCENDSYVIRDMRSRSLILRNRVSGERIKVNFPSSDYFVIWTKPNAEYICLEPWTTLPDYTDTDGDITKKEGIIALKKRRTYRKMHKITVLPQY